MFWKYKTINYNFYKEPKAESTFFIVQNQPPSSKNPELSSRPGFAWSRAGFARSRAGFAWSRPGSVWNFEFQRLGHMVPIGMDMVPTGMSSKTA